MKLRPLLAFLLLAPRLWAADTIVGGSGVTIVGGSGVTVVSPVVSGLDWTDVTFFWGTEGATYTNAEFTLGSATGNVTGSPADDTTTFKVTASSVQYSSGEFVLFDAPSNVDHLSGCIGMWVRLTSLVDSAGLFVVYDSDDNRIFVIATGAGRMRWLYRAGAAGFDRTISTGGTMSTNTWYFVIMRWNQGANTYSLAVYDDAESVIFSDSATDATAAWASPPNTFSVGDWTGSGLAGNFDSIMFSSDPNDALLPLRNTAHP